MKINLDLDLLLYGVILAVLGVVAHKLSPGAGNATLITGVTGGMAAVILGLLGLRGFRRRIWPIGTLIALDLALLIQSVNCWLAVIAGNEAFKNVAWIVTLLLGIGVVQLLNFVQAKNHEK